MNGILVPVLYGLAGICAYAALHHGLIAWRRPVDHTHLLFSVLCLAVALYVITKAGAYRADSAHVLVAMRRGEAFFTGITFATFPWFVGSYTDEQRRWVLVVLSAWMASLWGVANLVLPHGISFVELPELHHLTLPWGETVTDLRVHQRSGWHNAAWLGIVLLFVYSIYACARQYRFGARRRARTLALALGVFIACVLFNQVVNFGLIQFTHTAEFGFIGLVIVMSLGLTRELRERERRMQAVLNNIPAVVYMKTLDGRYLLINRRFEELFHLTNAAVAGKTDYDLFPAAQAETYRANDRRVVASGQPWEFEEVADRDGKAHTYVSLKFPLLDSDGLPYALCGVSTDVTELRSAEREARSLQQQIWHADRVARTGELSASLAHELNQPLAAILSNAQAGLRFLAADITDLKDIREILQDIVRDDKRASAVIDSLRAMVKPQQTESSRVDIADTTQEMLRLLNSELVERQVSVTTNLEARCVVLANKGQIQQVVLNLVMNAVEATGARPAGDRRVHLSVARAGDAVRTAVRDSGIGIPQDEMATVFDAFRTSKPQGMGMGLAVCRSIVESHRGTIWVEPNDDHGVTVIFTLPLVPDQPPQNADTPR